MQIFDFQIPDPELASALTRIYRTELIVLNYDFEFHSEVPGRRLALATIEVRTHEGNKTLGVLIKEGSEKELIVLSLMNKLLPYSSPKVIYHVKSPSGFWLLLENISTWVNTTGNYRINELMVDGLYNMQAAFFDNTRALLDNIKVFPISTGEILLKTGLTALAKISELSTHTLFVEVFEEYNWQQMQEDINKQILEIKDYKFPLTLVHGNYYPNTVRSIKDPRDNVHVVVYDWQNVSIGWPQIDLVLLLDRIDVFASHQNISKPSPVLLQRYVSIFVDEFGIDVDSFYKGYNICYICRTLPLMRWWMQNHIFQPSHDPSRVFLELHTKLKTIFGLWGKGRVGNAESKDEGDSDTR